MAHFHLTHSVILESFYSLPVNPGCLFPGQDELTTSGSWSHSHMKGLEHQMQKGCPFFLGYVQAASQICFLWFFSCTWCFQSQTLENFHILRSLGKFSPLELKLALFWTTRCFPLATVRTELTGMLPAKTFTSFNSGWVTWNHGNQLEVVMQ